MVSKAATAAPRESRITYVLVIVLFYVVTSIAALLLGMIQPSLHIPQVVIQLTQFGPTIGVLAVLLLFSKRLNLHLALGFSLQDFVWKRVFVAVVSIFVIFVLSASVIRLTGYPVGYSDPAALPYSFLLILLAQFIGAAGEECGWRCFLQPYLQSRLKVLTSSIIVGLLWGLWHIGIFAHGLAFTASFLLTSVALSVMLGELLRHARGNNLLIATVLHTCMNIGLLLFFNEESGNVFSMATVAVCSALIAIALYMFNSRNRHRLAKGVVGS